MSQQIKKYIVFILVITLGFSKHQQQGDCQWKNEFGTEYDLSSLSKSGNWQVREDLTGMGVFNMVYVFNFCSNTPLQCNGAKVGVYEALEVYGEMTDNCDIIAKNTTPSFTNIDNDPSKGLQLVLAGGDTCYNDGFDANFDEKKTVSQQQRQATIYIECSSYNEDKFTVDSSDSCNTIFKIKSQAGCKGGMNSGTGSFKMLFYIILLFSAYGVGGYLLNIKQKGLEGVEALPHVDFWREFPQLTLEGVQFSMKKGVKLVKIMKEKIKNSSSGEDGDEEGYTTV